MVGDRKAMRLVEETSADEERLGIAWQEKVLAPIVEDNLLLSLGKTYRRHVVDAKFRERGTRRAKLRYAAVANEKVRLLEPERLRAWRGIVREAATNDLGHRARIVCALDRLYAEMAVEPLVGHPVSRNDE